MNNYISDVDDEQLEAFKASNFGKDCVRIVNEGRKEREERERLIKNLQIYRESIIKRKQQELLLKKVVIVGVATFVATAVVAGSVVLASSLKKRYDDSFVATGITSDEIDDFNGPYVIDTDTSELSSLNVVLVNDGVDGGAIEKVASDLGQKGMSVDIANIDYLECNADSTYISFINYDGDNTKVIGNYVNGDDASDLLALSFASSLKNDGNRVYGNDVQRGVHYIEQSRTTLGPSDIELRNTVGAGSVTIAVPNGSIPEADIIVNSLAKYNDCIKNDNNGPFIHRVSPGDSVWSLTDTYGVAVEVLNNLDRTSDNLLYDDQVLLVRSLPEALSNNTEINININSINNLNK